MARSPGLAATPSSFSPVGHDHGFPAMTRAILWIIAIGVIVAVAFQFADEPGAASLHWQGWRIDTTVAFLVLCATAIAFVAALTYRVWVASWQVPRRWLGFRRTQRRERGYRALTEGMVAVAAGDATGALRQAKRANNLLGNPPLTMLLSAQAAQLNGDDAAARNYFNSMLGRSETAFLGLRGLLMQAQRDGDEEAVLGYARQAYKLRPKTPWVLTTLFDLQVRHGDWSNARVTLDEAIQQHVLPAEEGRDKRVVVLLGASGEAGEAGAAREALAHAKKAHAQSGAFLPAALRLAGLLIGQGKNRQASRIIHDVWVRAPHPELARLYLSMFEAEDPIKRVHRIERLVSFNPAHQESRIALAEAALEAELWGKARGHLELEAGEAPSARVCRLMADLEEAETDNFEAAREWLQKAASAEPDPSWKCTSCGAAWLHWGPICGKCESLGTLDWGTPERARAAVATNTIAPDPALTDRSGDGDNDTEGGSDVAEADESFFQDAEKSVPTRRLPVFGGRRLTLS
ncbi:MAG TPA: heme biosynthesis protein HemY [Alphaproteobacteria bacterium]|nr:heme biosynthesis protein HemY [Alphaproteobacteria bacterium]